MHVLVRLRSQPLEDGQRLLRQALHSVALVAVFVGGHANNGLKRAAQILYLQVVHLGNLADSLAEFQAAGGAHNDAVAGMYFKVLRVEPARSRIEGQSN